MILRFDVTDYVPLLELYNYCIIRNIDLCVENGRAYINLFEVKKSGRFNTKKKGST